jgi:hypothetical protein
LIDGSLSRHEATVPPDGNICVGRLLRQHAEAIILAEDELLKDFVSHFSDRFGARLTALKSISGSSEAASRSQFAAGVRKLVEDALRQLIAHRNAKVSQTINSPKALQDLRAACEGMVGRSEKLIAEKR